MNVNEAQSKFEMRCHCVVLLTLWPWPSTFQSQNHTTSSISQDHSLHQVWTLWDHSFLSYAADKQTNKQMLAWEMKIVKPADGLFCRWKWQRQPVTMKDNAQARFVFVLFLTQARSQTTPIGGGRPQFFFGGAIVTDKYTQLTTGAITSGATILRMGYKTMLVKFWGTLVVNEDKFVLGQEGS